MIALGFPSIAAFSIAGPPGYPNPKILAPLSNASPAASSLVSPKSLYSSNASTCHNCVCPPDTSKQMKGNLSEGSAIKFANICPSR